MVYKKIKTKLPYVTTFNSMSSPLMRETTQIDFDDTVDFLAEFCIL